MATMITHYTGSTQKAMRKKLTKTQKSEDEMKKSHTTSTASGIVEAAERYIPAHSQS